MEFVSAWSVVNCIILLLTLAGTATSTGVPLQGIDTYKELTDAMYTKLNGGDACIRLLTAQGPVGCAASNAAGVTGILLRVDESTSPSTLPEEAVVLVAPHHAGPFLQKCASTADLCSQVQGVLIEYSDTWPGCNPAPSSPQAAFALYTDKDYVWNPAGTGVAVENFPFPVFQLDNVTTISAQQRAGYNQEQGMEGSLNVASMELTMEGGESSAACIAGKTCYPLGGHSVWATLPPVQPQAQQGNADDSEMPLVMVLAGIDSGSLFHGLTQASNYPLSGLVALLTAAEILGNASASQSFTYQRRLVFTALAGEPWGFMGSKRLLWTMYNNSKDSSVYGLNLDSIQAVLEIGSIGTALSSSITTSPTPQIQLYAHRDKSQQASVTDALRQALDTAATATSEISVTVAQAGSETPGLPPASASSFLRVKPDVPALVLTEFDSEFIDGRYQSQFDTVDTVNASAIAGTAVFLSRALHALAQNQDPAAAAAAAAALPINYQAVQATVETLMDCLMRTEPGLSCQLAQDMMTPSSGSVSHYIGILRTITEDAQTPDQNVLKDVERFIWNFLAFATAGTRPGSAGTENLERCRPTNVTGCTPAGSICAGVRDIKGYQGTGVCLPSTVRYIPSYSTSFICDGCNGTDTFYQYRWKVINESEGVDKLGQWEVQGGWPADAMWTESNWPSSTPSLTLYLRESSNVDTAVLLAGVCVTVVAILVVVGVQYKYEKRLKQM